MACPIRASRDSVPCRPHVRDAVDSTSTLGSLWIVDQPRAVDPNEFARVVATLSDQLHRIPNETEISEALHWTYSRAALIALGQQAEVMGLVTIVYEADTRQRRYTRTT